MTFTRKINVVPVRLTTHRKLVEVANKGGMAVNELLGLLADKWAATLELELDEADLLSRDERIRRNFALAERERDNRQRFYEMVAKCKRYPTEDDEHLLREQCELLGWDFDDSIKWANRQNFLDKAAR